MMMQFSSCKNKVQILIVDNKTLIIFRITGVLDFVTYHCQNPLESKNFSSTMIRVGIKPVPGSQLFSLLPKAFSFLFKSEL
jgi:hypothetical protein